MNYWMICLPRQDMEHCMRIGVFGRGSARTINQVKTGDLVACIVTKEKEWKVVGLGEATSDYYLDESSVFQSSALIVDRFNFKAKTLKPERSFKPLIDRLSFITKPEFWPVYFKNGMVKLDAEDWILVEELCQAH
jgi:predicted RNA-binding protein